MASLLLRFLLLITNDLCFRTFYQGWWRCTNNDLQRTSALLLLLRSCLLLFAGSRHPGLSSLHTRRYHQGFFIHYSRMDIIISLFSSPLFLDFLVLCCFRLTWSAEWQGTCQPFAAYYHFSPLIVIIISKLLKCHSNAKRRAPAYSRALRQIRVVVHRIVHGRLRSGCQRVREGRLIVKAGVVYAESGEKEDQVSQGKSFWRDGTQTCMFQELWNYCNLFTLLTKLTACSHERAIEGRSIIWAMFANSWMFCSRLLHWHSLGLWP